MSKGIDSLNHLATYTEKQIRELHGIGPSSIPKLKSALATKGLSLKKTC
jgi:DNA repair protein RadC